jgi:surfactin synthase thioesterase subunit/glycosyltransferase involved in cell wall biosynthesis
MRILLAHNSTYFPATGGGDKSNRLLMEALVELGHEVRVLARVEGFGAEAHEAQIAALRSRGVEPTRTEGGVVGFELRGVSIVAATTHPNLRELFRSMIREFEPDVILASTDDAAQILLEAALQTSGPRVVYLARATIALPFGPDAAFRSPSKTATLQKVDAAVGVSHYVAGYMRQWGSIPAIHVPISLMEPGHSPHLGRFDNEFVTLVNPCAVKGIGIFLDMARAMPDVAFAAVPSWGTTDEDLAALQAQSNVTVLQPRDNIDEILARTRIMLVPSVWAEARSRMVVEAMSRGIPVLASDVGGLREAKLGVPYVLPVNPIVQYESRLDERFVPSAVVPPQDAGPWVKVIRELVTDRAKYEALADESRKAALDYIEHLTAKPFEGHLHEVLGREPNPKRSEIDSRPAGLSLEKRKLLELRLKQRGQSSRTAQDVWFPFPGKSAGLPRFFCFPFAGAGAQSYALVSKALEGVAEVRPARLPGRESRTQESLPESLLELVEMIASLMAPLIDRPYILYGHSMGAVIAFELASRLEVKPQALFVSGARAPITRRGWVAPPDPTDEQLLREVEKLGMKLGEVSDDPIAKRLILEPLRADAALFRRYVYTDREPLALPIFAYGGDRDLNVPLHDLAQWRQHTSVEATVQTFAGDHFFLREQPFLNQLRRDVEYLLASTNLPD